MKFFEALKTSAFSTKLFAAAGLSDLFDTALKASDENALKAFIDSKPGSAPAEVAALTTQLSTLGDALDEAVAENATLAEQLKIQAAAGAQLTALNTALSNAGVKCEKPEDFEAALKARISTRAAELLAKTGTAPVAEAAATNPVAPAAAPKAQLKGFARVRAAFAAQSSARA